MNNLDELQALAENLSEEGFNLQVTEGDLEDQWPAGFNVLLNRTALVRGTGRKETEQYLHALKISFKTGRSNASSFDLRLGNGHSLKVSGDTDGDYPEVSISVDGVKDQIAAAMEFQNDSGNTPVLKTYFYDDTDEVAGTVTQDFEKLVRKTENLNSLTEDEVEKTATDCLRAFYGPDYRRELFEILCRMIRVEIRKHGAISQDFHEYERITKEAVLKYISGAPESRSIEALANAFKRDVDSDELDVDVFVHSDRSVTFTVEVNGVRTGELNASGAEAVIRTAYLMRIGHDLVMDQDA